MQKIKSHYDNLQVQETASLDVIKGAYKHLIQKWHPDKHPNERATAERITKMLNDAFTVLSDPVTRKKHDEWIAEQRNKEQKHDEQKNTYDNSGNSKNEQQSERQNNGENVSKNKEYIKKPKNKQYFLLFLSVALGVAFVYTLLYGTEAIAPFVIVSFSNGDFLAVVIGKVIGVAILPLLLMKFIGNKTGWVSMLLCIFFYYHGIKNNVNTEYRGLNNISNTNVTPAKVENYAASFNSPESQEVKIPTMVNNADNSNNTNINSAKLSQIFTRDMLSSNIPYLEQITGPPRRIIPYDEHIKFNTYIVDGCEVEVEAYDNQISTLGLVLSNKCALDLNQFLASEENIQSGI